MTADLDGAELWRVRWRTGSPVTCGWAGIKTLIGKLFHVWGTVEGTCKLMRRNDWSCRMPVRQDRQLMSVADLGVTGGERHAKTVRSPQVLPGDGS